MRLTVQIARSAFTSRTKMDDIPTPCQPLGMSRAGIALVGRRHVDLGRMSSACCMPL
ncbi:putative leader peptide [Yinghuangia sp. YIM S10712]|uniref:putative leader peptide n=1 Tax=Yinghuangia sp. YIM S10712 TaxID=3436930 RepID=UPI003F53D4AC